MATDSSRDLIWKHISAIKTCMMVTYSSDIIHARPMRGIARPEDNVIWFFTGTDTMKDEEIQADPRACLTFADINAQNFVSVSGVISRITDKDVIKEQWNEGAELYFPQGPTDPRVMLLCFKPETGEYWDAPSSSIVLAIKFLEAKISGERPSLGNTGTAELV